MQFEIKQLPKSIFVGISRTFSYADYKAYELWSTFMPRRNEIQNKMDDFYYNIQINPENFDFAPTTKFQKWAAVRVLDIDKIPKGMEVLEIPAGLYAVFTFKGGQKTIGKFFERIYTVSIPNSDYELDNRAQFEILGEKYHRDSEDSEEEIWIPIKSKH